MTSEESANDMPNRIWVYNRDGKLEARDCSIVVGNQSFIRTAWLRERVEGMRLTERPTWESGDPQFYDECGEGFNTALDQVLKILGE